MPKPSLEEIFGTTPASAPVPSEASGSAPASERPSLESIMGGAPSLDARTSPSTKDLDFLVGDAPEPPASFPERVKARFTERQTRFAEGLDDPNQPGMSTAIQAVGHGVGLATDVAYEALPSPVRGFFEKIGEAAARIPAVQNIAEKAAITWQELNAKDPVAARDIGAALSLLDFVTQFVGVGAGVKAGQKVATKVSTRVGDTIASRGARVTERAVQDALEITAPVLKKQDAVQSFERAGMKGGAAEKGGLLNEYTRTPSVRDRQIAETVAPFVSKSKGPIKNIESINGEIARIATDDLRPYLQANPRTFNYKTFEAYLRKLEPPDFMKTDESLVKTYELVRQRMLDAARKNKATMEGLWDARQQFDDVIAEQYGNAAFDATKNSATKRAIQDMRRATNDFIADNLGDDTFKQKMRAMSNLYDARYNIAEQNYKLLESNRFIRWQKQNPRKAKALFWGTTAAVGGSAGSILLGN